MDDKLVRLITLTAKQEDVPINPLSESLMRLCAPCAILAIKAH